MNTQNLINEVKKRLVSAYQPLEIYLFGSYAWGTPTAESDLDLLVIIEESQEKSYQRPIKGYRALFDIDTPNDIIVYTKTEFEEKSSLVSTLAYKVKLRGQKIYARA